MVDSNKRIDVEKETGLPVYEFSEESLYAKNCYLGNETSWPTPEQFGFDQSQYDALKLALTSKLALIQG